VYYVAGPETRGSRILRDATEPFVVPPTRRNIAARRPRVLEITTELGGERRDLRRAQGGLPSTDREYSTFTKKNTVRRCGATPYEMPTYRKNQGASSSMGMGGGGHRARAWRRWEVNGSAGLEVPIPAVKDAAIFGLVVTSRALTCALSMPP